jgi:hypothetical protein
MAAEVELRKAPCVPAFVYAFNGLLNHFNGQEDLGAYLTANGVTMHWLYQPAERFWLFQSIEAVIFATLALALVAIAVWLVRRRPA